MLSKGHPLARDRPYSAVSTQHLVIGHRMVGLPPVMQLIRFRDCATACVDLTAGVCLPGT